MNPQKDESRLGRRSAGTSVTEVRIVEAAEQLFAHNGFKGTSTWEIAQLADLNEATLFRYFPRKPEFHSKGRLLVNLFGSEPPSSSL